MKMETMGRAAKAKKRHTLKRKMLVGMVAGLTLTGAGAVFASTPDAVLQIKSWFDSNILGKVSQSDLEQNINPYVIAQSGSLVTQANDKQDAAGRQVSSDAKAIEGQTITNIEKIKSDYVGQITQQQEIMSAEVDKQFASIEKNIIDMMNQFLSTSYNQIPDHVTSSINEQGNMELGKLKSNLNAESIKAQGELNAQITQTKTELANLLIRRQNETIQNVKESIDKQIVIKTSLIDNLVKQLIAAQKSTLQISATAQEQDAKALLDDIVNKLNQ